MPTVSQSQCHSVTIPKLNSTMQLANARVPNPNEGANFQTNRGPWTVDQFYDVIIIGDCECPGHPVVVTDRHPI